MAAKDTPKTIYIAYMCDHSYVLAAALRAYDRPATVLPPTDDETLALGLDLCRGRECSPCLTITGDFVRLMKQPDFDPSRSIMLMATTTGSCRFGQYIVLQRQILDEIGMGDMEIIVPSANDSYHGLGPHATQLRQLIWEGAVAVDLLQKLLHSYRPYEVTRGETDEVYQACLQQTIAATEAGGGKRLVETMHTAAQQFERLAVNRQQARPVIGMVGEIYLRHNTYSNLNLIRAIEALGGEVLLATMIEWFYYTNWSYQNLTWLLGKPFKWAKATITDHYQRYLERRLVRPVAHLLAHPYETPIAQIIDRVRPYYAPELENECVLSMGKTIEMAEMAVSGVVNVMPFSCMPGIITAAMAPRLRADLDNLPWLDIAFDAQGGTNITTRLEAFMYQATEYQRHAAGLSRR